MWSPSTVQLGASHGEPRLHACRAATASGAPDWCDCVSRSVRRVTGLRMRLAEMAAVV